MGLRLPRLGASPLSGYMFNKVQRQCGETLRRPQALTLLVIHSAHNIQPNTFYM